MKTQQLCLYLIGTLCAFLFVLAGCGDDDAGAQPVLAPGSEKISSQVNLAWEQVGDTALKVLSANTFRTGAGEYVYLVGEVENTTQNNLADVVVKVTAYNDRGEVADTRTADTLLGVVSPGKKLPFTTAMDAREVNRYQIEVQTERAVAVPQHALEASDVTMTEPKSGYVWFEGKVKNGSNDPAENVHVVAVLYDGEQKVVDVASQELKEPIQPGEEAPFKFIANHRGAQTYVILIDAKDSTQ
jgi:hypothetical protein